MKRYVTSSLLSVSALALLAAAGAAHAQAPSVLQPKGGWSVTKMDAASNGAGPYCALARQYDKNIIFTLGRNMTDEYSLAVDFQKEQMNPDTAYKLTLSPGAGQQRAFNLMPLSERAMVIRLGWDESFFKALDTSRMLRVGIGDVDYSFNMPDIAAGQKDLQNCIDGLKDSAKTAAAEPADNSSAGDVLNAEASGAKGFSARKGAEAVIETAEAVPAPKVVASNVTPLPAGAGPDQPLPGTSSVDDRALLKQVADLRSDNERMQRTLNDQRKKLEESYKNAQDSNALAEMEEKIRLLENENKRLGAGGAAGTVTAQAATGAVKAAAETATAATVTTKEVTLSGIDNLELETLRASVKKEQEEKAKLVAEMAALKRDMQEDKVTATETPTQGLMGANGKVEIEKATRRYTEAEREVQRLAKLLEEERQMKATPAVATNAALTKDAKADAKAADENKKLKDQIATLEKQVKEAGVSSAETSKAATELAELKTRFIESEKQRENMRQENAKIAADLKKVQEQGTQQSGLQTQLTKAQEEAKAAKLAAAAAEQNAKATQDKFAAAEAELKKLRATVALDTYRQAPAKAKDDGLQAQAAALAATEPAAGFEPPPLQSPNIQQASVPASQAATGKGYSEGDVKTLLSRANVPMNGKVRKMSDGVYGWKTDTLMGRAEVSAAGDFGRKVDDYINKAKSQCQGDFAAIPSAQTNSSANVELACVGAAGSTSASVAFFETDGSFVAITHEGSAENMELAMDTRDQVARAR